MNQFLSPADLAIVGATAMLAAQPATAQEIEFTPHATEVCLAGIEWAQRELCFGQAAEICMVDTPVGATSGAGVACLDEERAYWDGRLNAAYSELQKNNKAVDEEMRRSGSDAPSLEAGLRDVQRAWIGFRDKTCEHEKNSFEEVPIGFMVQADCLMRHTARQALYLENRLPGQ